MPHTEARLLGWLFDQALHGRETKVILTLLDALIESKVNPWLRSQAGIQIANIEMAHHAQQSSGQLKIQVTFERPTPRT